ncbi:MAG: threonine/serine dehydratase, partial [Bacteroidales bacterium]|nr:threonine/serine dehydratase [Bacteroidales bacterium]
ATVLAVVGENPELFRGKKVGLVISGGNVDLTGLLV